MRTNIDIDDDLMAKAMKATGATTKREVVEQGLRKLVQLDAQRGLLKLRGTGWIGDLEEMRTNKPRPVTE